MSTENVYNQWMELERIAQAETNPASASSHPVGRLAWSLALVSIATALLSLAIAVRAAFTSGDFRSFLTHQTLNPFVTAGFAIIGALIAARFPRNPIGWIFVTVGVLYAAVSMAAAVTRVSPPVSPLYILAEWVGSWVWLPATLLPATFVPLTFPNGRLPSRRWRAVAWCAGLGTALVTLGVMFHPGPLESLGLLANPFGIPGSAGFFDFVLTSSTFLLGVGVAGSLAAMLARFRRSTGSEREQMKWLVYAMGMYVLVSALTSLIPWLQPDFRWGMELSIVVTSLGILGIAVAAAIAILRHGLYDIHLIINRTLVYTALTAGVAALYGAVVGGLGLLFQGSSNLLVALAATGLAAVLLQPMRERLQKLVNRLMYGERDDPYTVLASLSRRLETSLSPEAALAAVVETVAQALKLPYVVVLLKASEGFEIAASYGKSEGAAVQIPLNHQGETVGQLRLGARGPNQPFTPGERRLLEDIARHIGVTAHSALLTRDLQRSREELVKSREEERRRLRRDLHDDLGPQLASLKLNLDVARNLVTRDPPAAEALLVDLRAQSLNAIADIRRLVFDLRPPALDELGLTGAIQEYARQIDSQDGLRVRLETEGDLPPLPAAVEVAAYRITLEALANFVRHSQGKTCQVALSATGDHLRLEIRDDGLGLPERVQPGVGLTSMRERAAELGGECRIETLPQGGTRVLALLPLG